MIDLTETLCHCHNRTAGEIVDFLKQSGIRDLDTLVEQDEFPVGNSCESCQVDGFEDDGFSLTLLIEALEKGDL